MQRCLGIGLAVVVAAVAAGVSAKDYVLVKGGAAASRIVLPAGAGPVEKHAAAELALYLGTVTSAKIEAGSGPSASLYNIYIGTVQSPGIPLSQAMKSSLARIAPEGFLLAADDDGLRIVGRQPIGALYGAYHVLKKCADVRWFAPGAEFEYCPNGPTVAVPEQITVSNPSFPLRHLGFICANVTSRSIDSWDWLVRNGMTIYTGKRVYNMHREELEKRGGQINEGGHCFAYLVSDKLFDEHPEYFPLIEGKRVKQRRDDTWLATNQPCTSNPKVRQIMTEGVNRVLETPPEGGSYLIGNNDGTGWCQCDQCTRLDPPDEREKRFVSTRYYSLVNQMARGIYQAHPEADLWAWAYQNYRWPPHGVAPDKRLTISACVHGRCYRHPMADEQCQANAWFREMLAGWMRFGNRVMVREYDECLPGTPQYVPAERVYAQDIRYYHRLGLAGFSLIVPPPDGTFGSRYKDDGKLDEAKGEMSLYRVKNAWYARWQMLYLAAQLAWDVTADYDKLAEDMGAKYYAAGWPAMKLYRELFTKAYEETSGDIIYGTPSPILGKCLEKPGVEARLLGLLAGAEKAAANDQAVLCRIGRDREYFRNCWQREHQEYLSKRQREINAGQRTERIVIDGRLDDKDWKAADFTGDFVATDGRSVADPQTYVKMLYDEDNIYFAVEAMEPEPGRMKIFQKERDGAIWSDSGVELFIAAPGGNGRCVQIVVNPAGVVYDAMSSPAQTADVKFDAGAEIRTAVLADRWTVEARVPAAGLGRKVKAGETWKINVGRNRRLTAGRDQSSSWSHGAFHQQDAWRSVVFGGAALLKNGDFEDAVEPNKYQKRTAWKFIGDKVPAQWAFHEAHPGTVELVAGGTGPGGQSLRIQDGWIHQRLNQAADFRENLVIRCRVRGAGTLAVAMYRYDRARERHVSTVTLIKELKVDSKGWTPVQANYRCNDDKVLRLALHVKGELELDDVAVTQETNLDETPRP